MIIKREELYQEINHIVEKCGVKLSRGNNAFLELILKPYKFIKSKPGKYNFASENNKGETSRQRNLYKEESIWLDLELPIGQVKNDKNYTISKRVDLIGKKDGRYIVCELKETKNSGQPFDAILQLIAYYVMLQNNCQTLDEYNVHHTNSHDSNWKWTDVAKNPILLLRANKEYWSNWEKTTKKNMAAREIVKFCRSNKIDLYLYTDSIQVEI